MPIFHFIKKRIEKTVAICIMESVVNDLHKMYSMQYKIKLGGYIIMKQRTRIQKKAKAKILGILSIVLSLICGITVVFMRQASNQLTTSMDFIIYAETFSGASGYLTDEVRSYAATGDIAHYNNYWLK